MTRKDRPKETSRPATSDPTRLRLPDTSITEGGYAKSVQTRLRILNAAVDCLADQGYAGTTVAAVAERADLTRPAMQYHFKSRLSLIEGVIHHVMRLRLDDWVRELPRVARGEIAITSLAWEHTQTQVFRAFSELLVASRTDAELSSAFTPALTEYDRARRAISEQTTPKDELQEPWFDLRRDVVRFLVEGLAIQQGGLSFDSARRINEILAFLIVLFETESGSSLLEQAIERSRRPVRRVRQRVQAAA